AHALERVDLGDWTSTLPPDGRERVIAAILVLMRGDPDRLVESIAIAERDWRDALVWAELGQPDWPARLEELLGPGRARAGFASAGPGPGVKARRGAPPRAS
ncbi:MAG TPA: hypothetical protein VK194_09190, partial [Candidatus Deferrimicrobium sp.]|nr:hypothetical protein [Candidatus Deferrimicrobium sp.]